VVTYLLLKRASASRPSGEDEYDILATTTSSAGITKTAHPPTAMRQHARPPWQPLRRAGGGNSANKEHRASMLQRTCSLFGSLVLATLIGTPTAHAVCAHM
jgi:hypothetical protein